MIGGISYFHEYAYDLLAENERITAAAFDAALHAHQHHRLQMLPAQRLTDDRGEHPHRIAQPPRAELAEVRQILPELGGLHPGSPCQRGGAHGFHTVSIQLLEAAVVDGKAVDRLLRDVHLADFFG